LDESKTVIEIVREGVQPIMDLLAEYEAINEKFGLPEVYENPDAMDKLLARQGELQDKIDAVGAWEIDNKLERAMDALRCPEPDRPQFKFVQEENEEGLLCVDYYYNNQMCCCWMSLPTTWMLKVYIG
jgi:energy-dependent translational throttle protein EttA